MTLTLAILPDRFGIVRLPPSAALPAWLAWDGFTSVTHTDDELSIVCRQELIPANVTCERGWRCMQVGGPLDFGLTGVLLSLAQPLAGAGIGIFVVSTYDTDYVLVKSERLDRAVAVLARAGHIVRSSERNASCPQHTG